MSKLIKLLIFLAHGPVTFSQSDSVVMNVTLDSRIPREAFEAVFNGREHVQYSPFIQGTPYFLSKEWQMGTLVFHNIPYKDVQLKYDLVADELVLFHANGYSAVALFTPRIQRFTIGAHRFVYFRAQEAPDSRAGIYQEVVKGKLSLYVRRSRVILETIESNILIRKFIDNYNYYVLKDGNFYPIRKQKDLMPLVQDKKSQVNSWLKNSGIRFRSDRERAMAGIVDHYNLLTR